jgi:hypothetical protein
MPKSWFNNGFKSIFCYVDVFSKTADMIPLKDRKQTTATQAFEKILDNLCKPKTTYSDQGSDLKIHLIKSYWTNITLNNICIEACSIF